MIFRIAIGFALGTVLAALYGFGWPLFVFAALLSVITFGVWAVSREHATGAVVAVLVALTLGIGRELLAPDALPLVFTPLIGTEVSIEGEIVTDPDIRDSTQRVTIETTKDGATTRVLAVAPRSHALKYGERVVVHGILDVPLPFEADGGRVFRYDQFLAKDGVFAVIERARVEVVAPRYGFFKNLIGTLYDAKAAFVRALSRALPEPEAGLASGLITGGKQGLGKQLLEAFTIAGIVQVVVLSGYNVSIVVRGILAVLAFLPRRLALAFAGAGIIAFVIAAGLGSSAVRAGAMACLALYAAGTGRTYDALRALAAAVILMLAWNPLVLAFDPGFGLSLAATLGLILISPTLERKLIWIANKTARELVATTVAAQIAVLPLLLYETGALSLVSVPANVIVSLLVPAAMLASALAGVAGLIFAGLPFLAELAGFPAYGLLLLIVMVAEWSAALPFARVIVPAFPFIFCGVAYLGIAGWISHEKKRSARRTAPTAPPSIQFQSTAPSGSAPPLSSN